MIVNIPFDLGYGLTTYLQSLGYSLVQRGNEWHLEGAASEAEAQSVINSYNPWPVEKAAKIAEIDDDFAAATDSLTAGWPQHEIQTWGKQEAEARALANNPDAPTPMLATIATTRGLTVPELAQRVIRDADAFTAASAHFVGMRHKARQQVQTMPDNQQFEKLPSLWAIKFGS
jgi:hypothetical protein